MNAELYKVHSIDTNINASPQITNLWEDINTSKGHLFIYQILHAPFITVSIFLMFFYSTIWCRYAHAMQTDEIFYISFDRKKCRRQCINRRRSLSGKSAPFYRTAHKTSADICGYIYLIAWNQHTNSDSIMVARSLALTALLRAKKMRSAVHSLISICRSDFAPPCDI